MKDGYGCPAIILFSFFKGSVGGSQTRKEREISGRGSRRICKYIYLLEGKGRTTWFFLTLGPTGLKEEGRGYRWTAD